MTLICLDLSSLNDSEVQSSWRFWSTLGWKVLLWTVRNMLCFAICFLYIQKHFCIIWYVKEKYKIKNVKEKYRNPGFWKENQIWICMLFPSLWQFWPSSFSNHCLHDLKDYFPIKFLTWNRNACPPNRGWRKKRWISQSPYPWGLTILYRRWTW